MKILTESQMRQVDRVTRERYGVPSATLMENAGSRVVESLVKRFKPLDKHKIAVFCGRGNNGGDGFVVARLLHEKGLAVRVVLVADPGALRGDAATNYARLSRLAPPEVVRELSDWEEIKPTLAGTTLAIDALLDIGLSKPLTGLLLEVVRDINRLPARRAAVDLPSGLSADTGELIGECVHADLSVTYTAPKYAHIFPPACEMVGEWRVGEIGTPREVLDNNPELFLRLIELGDLAWLAEPRKMDCHNGTYGHVLLLAGSAGKTGAAVLTAKAASRAGAGLVTIATPKSALPISAALGAEWMTESLPETGDSTVSLGLLEEGQLDHLLRGKTAVAVGAGLGTEPETAEAIRKFVNECPLPLVLDADGLDAFAGRMNEMKTEGRVRILTPHPGEMSRISGLRIDEILKSRVEVAREFARRYGVHLALKGARTLVAWPDGAVAVNPTGNPGMATGGAGDCLTGLMTGLLAQFATRPPGQVAEAAVFLHGLAGDIAARKLGQASMMASDVVETISEAFLSLARH
jgi:hydroxyethylthiazole kinase-like uncharacterized protein yjeF